MWAAFTLVLGKKHGWFLNSVASARNHMYRTASTLCVLFLLLFCLWSSERIQIYIISLVVSQKHNLPSQITHCRLSSEVIKIINSFPNFMFLEGWKGDSYLNLSNCNIFYLLCPQKYLKLNKQRKTETDS